MPKGLFEIDEETSELKWAEEFPMPGCEELKSLEVWGNFFPIILKAGRTTHARPVAATEEEVEE